jgi:hypothetical protein
VEAGQLREGVALGGQAHAAAVAILEQHLTEIAGGDTGVTPLTGR